MESKACTKCGEVKALEGFYAKRGNKDGRDSWCKSCDAIRSAAWRAVNPDKVKANKAAYYAANSDKIKADQAARYAANSDKFKADQAARYAANSDKFKDRVAARNAANPDKLKAGQAAYRAANSDKIKARQVAQVAALAPMYVRSALRMRVADLTPELLALKREQIETHRLAKQVKQYLKEIKA